MADWDKKKRHHKEKVVKFKGKVCIVVVCDKPKDHKKCKDHRRDGEEHED